MHQQLVACQMSHRVVDGLEIVQINQNHRIATLGLSRPLKDLRKRKIDIIAVLETGQHVVMGEIGDLLFLLLDAGHIDLGKADGQCPAYCIAAVASGNLVPADAVGGLDLTGNDRAACLFKLTA